MLQNSDIEKLAELSRLKLDEAEKSSLLSDIQAVIGYVSEIEKVDTTGAPDAPYLPLHNIMREDREPHPSGVYTEALLREAPRRDNGYIVVKKVLP